MNQGNSFPGKKIQQGETLPERKEVPPHETLEFYKNKVNGIERHLDDVLKVILFSLTRTEKRFFEQSVKAYEKYKGELLIGEQSEFDALEIKELLQLVDLPILDGVSFDEFAESIKKFSYFRTGRKKLESYLESLPEIERNQYFEVRDSQAEKASMFMKQIERGEIGGLVLRNAGGVDAIFTETYQSGTNRGYRVNINVHFKDDPYVIVHHLTERLLQKKKALSSGFGIKTLGTDGSIRDGVIIYCKHEAFSDVASVVTDYFDDNDDYHERHSVPGIMFGTSLETADKRKFPGIRVTSDPKKPFYTFNYLQAGIVSAAIIEYVKKYYHGDNTELVRCFRNDYFEEYLKFEQNFPAIYKQAVKLIVGQEQQTDNIAFLAEDIQK